MLTASSPQGAGLNPARLYAAFSMVAGWVEEGTVAGAVALVVRRGKIAGTWAGGRLSRASDAMPVTADTHFAAASVSKVVTAVALLQQIDEGKATLETSVQSILPEWQVPGAEKITLRHLLSHTSGLPEDLPRNVLKYEDRNSLQVMIDAFMEVPPRRNPDEELIYSNIGYGILGRVLERLTGKSYREVVW